MTVKKRDLYTSKHQHKVANLAERIAHKLDLSQKKVTRIKLAASIHDIGKLNVPMKILTKPMKLSESEFAIIKTHPKAGYDIVKELKFPWPIEQMVLQHHERLDGSGYPQGLQGDEILLGSKIIAVADVVEAMTSHRPYRSALGVDKALTEIVHNKGILYDPQVVEACIGLLKGQKQEI